MKVIFKLSLKLPQLQGPHPVLRAPIFSLWAPNLGTQVDSYTQVPQKGWFDGGAKVGEGGEMESQGAAPLGRAGERR